MGKLQVIAEPEPEVEQTPDEAAEAWKPVHEADAELRRGQEKEREQEQSISAAVDEVAELTAVLDAATDPGEEGRLALELAGAKELLSNRQKRLERMKADHHAVAVRRNQLALEAREVERRVEYRAIHRDLKAKSEAVEKDALEMAERLWSISELAKRLYELGGNPEEKNAAWALRNRALQAVALIQPREPGK